MAVSRDDVIEPLPPRAERSVGSLFADLARETSRLFRQEIALAKAEVADRLGQAGTGAAELVAGGLVLYAGFLGLMAAATLGLALVVPAWLAALIVAIVVMALGAILVLVGRKQLQPSKLVPHRTMRSLRDDADWAKEQLR
jgi:hypothetical protein